MSEFFKACLNDDIFQVEKLMPRATTSIRNIGFKYACLGGNPHIVNLLISTGAMTGVLV